MVRTASGTNWHSVCRRDMVGAPGVQLLSPALLASAPENPMSPSSKVIVVMPAHNAARLLERTYHDLPPGVVDHVILVDDVSRDLYRQPGNPTECTA
jgi:hypothetical protein